MVNAKRKGISLIELILTIALIGIVIPVLTSIFIVGNKSYSTSKDMGFVQQDLRLATIFTNNELKLVHDISSVAPEKGRYYKFEVYHDDTLNRSKMKVTYYEEITQDEDGNEVESSLEVKEILGDWDTVNISNLNPGKIDVFLVSSYNGKDLTQNQSIYLENNTALDKDFESEYSKLNGTNIEFYFIEKIDDPSLVVSNPGGDTPGTDVVTLSNDTEYSVIVKTLFTKDVQKISGGTPLYTYIEPQIIKNEGYTISAYGIVQQNGEYFFRVSGTAPSAHGKTLTFTIKVKDSENTESLPKTIKLTTIK